MSKSPQFISDIDQAKYDLVHGYKGGAVALAPLAGMRSGTLSNKVHPMDETHHLTVDESVTLQLITQNFGLFEAQARQFNHVVVAHPPLDDVSDMDLLKAWADWHKDIGETCDLIGKVLAGKTITKTKLQAIEKEMFEDFQRELELFHRLKSLCDD